MQIVINLSDSVYDAIKNKYTLFNPKEGTLIKTLWDAIEDGIPLPKGHGRLIDADELKTAFPCGESVRTECVRATIDYATTIIEADKGSD